MSKFTDELKVTETGVRYARHMPMKVTEDFSICPALAASYASEYTIAVTISSRITVSKDEPIDKAVKEAKEYLVEHIFGEFRLQIMAVRQAMYDMDYGKATALLNKLQENMFSL